MTMLALLTCLLADPAPITAAEFTKLHTELLPKTTDAWETIPWTVDLLQARAASAKERKPLFIWAMNGHPLGCV